MQELVYAFKLETMDVDDDVMHCGDRGYTFYIILKGQVKVLIPNPLIKNWKQKRYAHQMDLDWREALIQRYIDKKLQMKIKAMMKMGNGQKPLGNSPGLKLQQMRSSDASKTAGGLDLGKLARRSLTKQKTSLGASPIKPRLSKMSGESNAPSAVFGTPVKRGAT